MTRRPATRTARAPEARMTPECLELLKTILIMRGVSYGDWLEEKVQHEAACAASPQPGGRKTG